MLTTRAQRGTRGIRSVRADDAWLVGDYAKRNGHDLPLVERWDGQSWQVVQWSLP